MAEKFLQRKLQERADQHALRTLRLAQGKTDFCSNDYLGIVTNNLLRLPAGHSDEALRHGSTGSRLLAGNYPMIMEVEKRIADFHDAPAALIFNSGYDANIGLLGSAPQRGDTILYDYLVHASIRDGIRLSFAHSFPFAHNDFNDLRSKLEKLTGRIFVVTESVFSMDGDVAPLGDLVKLCKDFGVLLVLDEAHATGVIGEHGEGLAQHLGVHGDCFARIYTFGKALGCHGSVIAGSETLRDYLVNFARSFVYTTALPEVSIAAVREAYNIFPTMATERKHLGSLIKLFRHSRLRFKVVDSESPVQPVIIPGNEAVRGVAQLLQDNGLDVRPILYPSVPKGSERLRVVLHAFNTADELDKLIQLLA